MPKNIKTFLYCYDDRKEFSGELNKRFTDMSRYSVLLFQSADDFIDKFKSDKDNRSCKVAILVVHSFNGHIETVDRLATEIKNIDAGTYIILLGIPDKLEEIKQSIKFQIDTYIKLNTNAVFRVHNVVKRIISEYNIEIFRKRRNLSLTVLLAFILVALITIIFAYFRISEYF